MTWLQILAQAGIMATFVGAGIAVAAYFNGKHIKEGVTKLGEMLVGIDKTLVEMHRSAEQREKAAEQRHQEVMTALDKGFGTLIQHRAT